MFVQDCRFDLAECGSHGLQLGQDIDAIAALGHHSRDSAHLSFDAVEPAYKPWIVVLHSPLYTPSGYLAIYLAWVYLCHHATQPLRFETWKITPATRRPGRTTMRSLMPD